VKGDNHMSKQDKSSLILYVILFATCTVPTAVVRLLQKYIDEQISYGNSERSVSILSDVIIIFPLFVAMSCLLFTILVGFDRDKLNKRPFWIGCIIVFLIGAWNPRLLPLIILLSSGIVIGIVISKAKIVFYLFFLASFFFLITGFTSSVNNRRALGLVRIHYNEIKEVADLSRQYIEKQGCFSPFDSDWISGLSAFADEKGYGLIMSEQGGFIFYSFNVELADLSSNQICPDSVLVFDRPSDHTDFLERPGSLKISTKKHLLVVLYNGDVLRYIPDKNQYIAE